MTQNKLKLKRVRIMDMRRTVSELKRVFTREHSHMINLWSRIGRPIAMRINQIPQAAFARWERDWWLRH